MSSKYVAMFLRNIRNIAVIIFILIALVGCAWILSGERDLEKWGRYASNGQRIKKYWLDNEEAQKDCFFKDYVFGQPIKQDDPCLVAAVKDKFLRPPPPKTEVHITGTQTPCNDEKFKWIKKLLVENMPSGNGSKGFFIECGANDGQYLSSTIRLEKELNWTGLLVEAHPIAFKALLQQKRHVWAANVALCTTDHPQQVPFYSMNEQSGFGMSALNARPEAGITVNITVQCIPLFTMLKALNVEIVDFFSLDVNGPELDILKTIPFDKIRFKILIVEWKLVPGRQKALTEFLEPLGYKFVKEINGYSTADCMYVHESLYPLASSMK